MEGIHVRRFDMGTRRKSNKLSKRNGAIQKAVTRNRKTRDSRKFNSRTSCANGPDITVDRNPRGSLRNQSIHVKRKLKNVTRTFGDYGNIQIGKIIKLMNQNKSRRHEQQKTVKRYYVWGGIDILRNGRNDHIRIKQLTKSYRYDER
eukprot:SAG11_NODE_6020_length_1407_cov_6.711009_3_plen_147_part_00